jgi:geranylgeranyl pyrophosphate synthase
MNDELKNLLKVNAFVVDREIEKLLPRVFDRGWMNYSLGNALWEHDEETCSEAIAKPVWELLERGGKRWRPLLMLLSYKAVGGRGDIRKFLPLPELIHNGTLIIDDIEDNSESRRGRPCIHKIFGHDIAINAGNALYYLPILTIIRDKYLSPELKARIYESINEEMIKISFGQAKDIHWHNSKKENITENQYLQMCAYKTGTLARMSAKLGAILGGADEARINSLGRFAESIGVAFQIQDDILNITNMDWGKDFGEDITEGKRSFMVIKTLEIADENDKKRLLGIMNQRTRDRMLINEAIGIMQRYGVIEHAQERAKSIVRVAWNELDSFIENSEAKNKLKLFADFLVNRDI